MGRLFEDIRRAVSEDQFVIGIHADEQLRERAIPAWQAIAGLASGKLRRERPRSRPNPSVEVEQLLADGTPVLAVWAWIRADQTAKLVTVHFFDR